MRLVIHSLTFIVLRLFGVVQAFRFKGWARGVKSGNMFEREITDEDIEANRDPQLEKAKEVLRNEIAAHPAS